jgi:RND family efflux transporter MFP subunit
LIKRLPYTAGLRGADLALALALAFALALAGCGSGAGKEENAGVVAEVTVARVERGAISEQLAVSGNLTAAPNRDAKLAALVPGRIAKVLVTEGDAVKPGQALVELESTQLADQVRQAEATVAQGRANLKNAQLSAERNEGLLQRGIASRKEAEDARTQLAVSAAALRQAEAGLSAARNQLGRATIRAPFAGTVVHRFLSVGEQVDGTAAQPVVEVAQIDTLELVGSVPGSRLAEVRAGEAFTFETREVPGAPLKATVVAVLPAVDPATNNGTVRIRMDNQQHLLKFGAFLSFNLPLKASGTKLIVPRQAIYPDENGEPHVYKVTGDLAVAVPVEVGVQTKDKAEIVAGVKEGEVVVVTGGYGLPDKAKVRVK